MSKPKLATTSLCGCFGCHMSFLDMDERLAGLLEHIVFDRSPLTDIKHCDPCDITCGWGGAGAFSDGKLTLSPDVGGWLEEYVGRCGHLGRVGAELVEAAVDRRCGQPVATGRHHDPPPRAVVGDRAQLLAAALAQRGAANERERHVTAELRRQG